jgi:hypothetical protein
MGMATFTMVLVELTWGIIYYYLVKKNMDIELIKSGQPSQIIVAGALQITGGTSSANSVF